MNKDIWNDFVTRAKNVNSTVEELAELLNNIRENLGKKEFIAAIEFLENLRGDDFASNVTAESASFF